MIDHVSIQASDLAGARAWYDAVFAPLGVTALFDRGEVVGYGPTGGFPAFWLGAATEPPGRQVHVAFRATGRDVVDAVHAVAVSLGGEILHPPRIWPEYHPGYYGVFLRDPDGNNVEVVHHTFG